MLLKNYFLNTSFPQVFLIPSNGRGILGIVFLKACKLGNDELSKNSGDIIYSGLIFQDKFLLILLPLFFLS
jgi:hypothetical protein